ncbi:MAG: TetR/AcrR family transcriptional regulator [Clostridia bacterium]|nr:TetR/AcrR family transcriptional regulator [Clostridia bacterium]
MTDFHRARSPEQKQQRMEEIMAVTDALFRAHSYHEVTLTTIAEALGWSRGNLYKYVTTKEEIFLELYQVRQAEFIAALYDALGEAVPCANEAFADAWSDVLSQHQDYLRYHGILNAIIETNVTVNRLAEFKKLSFANRGRAYAILAAQCPNLSDKQVRQLFLTLLYHGCGLYSHTHFAPLLEQAMALAGLPLAHDEFAPLFREFLLMCLRDAQRETC